MTTTRQMRANRENAKRSTGPKTPEGKASSAKNATTHGLSSGFTVLPHEDGVAFAELNDELTLEFKPVTCHQKFLLKQMVENRWRLDRVRRYETIALELLLGAVDETNPEAVIVERMSAKTNNIFDLLRRYANDAERSYYRAHSALVKDLALQAQNKADAVAAKWMGRLHESQQMFRDTPSVDPTPVPDQSRRPLRR